MITLLSKLLSNKLIDRPVFVIGSGRSGTSVLLQSLGAHPWILRSKGEAPLISYTGKFMAEFSPKDDDVRLNYLNNTIKTSRDYIYCHFKQLNFEVVFGKNYGFSNMIKEIVTIKEAFFQKKYWAAKIFPTEESYEGLCSLYPEAKFIYIIRNGLNVVQSRRLFSGFSYKTFEENCLSWQKECEKYKYLESSDKSVFFYYEDIIEDPDLFFNTLYKTLHFPLSIESAKYIKTNLVHPLDQSDQKGVDVKEILKSRPSPYETWSEEEKELFTEICGPGMKRHGYEIPFA